MYKIIVTCYLLYAVSSSGNGARSSFTFESPITLKHGKNEIALLSMTVGLQVCCFLYYYLLKYNDKFMKFELN